MLDLAVKITGDPKLAQQAFDRVGSAAESAARRVGASGREMADSTDRATSRLETMRGALVSLAGAVGGLAVARQALEMADAVTVLRNRLDLATGSAAAGARAFDNLYKAAQSSRTSFTELGSVYASMSRAGVQNIAVVQAIGNAMAISGGSAEGMRAALVQLSQGMSAGVLRGEELNSVMEQAPRLAQALADGLGVPIGSLRKLGEEGQLTTQRVTEALLNSAPRLADEVAKSNVTVSQAFTVLGNATTRFVGDLDSATGVSSGFAGALSGVAEAVDALGRVIRDNQTAFAIIGGGLAGAAVVGGIAALKVGLTALIPVVTGVAVALGPVGAAIAAAAVAIGAAVAAWRDWKGSAGGLEAELSRLQSGQKTISGDYSDPAARAARIAEIQAQLALATGQGLDTRAEDARFQRSTEAYNAREQQLARLLEIQRKLNGEDKEYTKTISDLADMLKSGAISHAQYAEMAKQAWLQTKAGRDATKAWREEMEANTRWRETQRAAEARLRLDALEEAERYIEKQREAYAQDAEAAERAAGVAEEELRLYGLLRSQVAEVTLEKLKARQAGLDPDDVNYKTMQRQIEAQQRLVRALQASERRDAEVAAAKSAADEWKRQSQQIEQALTDALMRGFENGRGFIDSFVSSLKSTFKSMVLQPIVRAIVQPVVGALGLGGLGTAFAGGAAGGAAAAGGSGGLLTALGAGWSLLNGGMLGNAATFGVGDIANWLVENTSGVLNRFGGTLLENQGAIGGVLGGLGNAFSGYGISRMIGGGYKTGLGGVVDAAGAIGSYFFGPIAGVVSGLVNRAFGRKPAQVEGSGITGTVNAGGFAGSSYTDWLSKGGWFRSDKRGRNFGDVPQELQSLLNSGVGLLYAATGQYAQVLGLPVEAVQSYSRSFTIAWGKTEEENKAAIDAAIASLGEDLAGLYRDRLMPLQRAGESLATTLRRLSELQQFSTALNELGGVFSRVADLSVDAREQMIALAGGMESFGQLAQSFIQDYYSRDEIAGLKARELQGVLQGLGLGEVNSREAFRSLVEGSDVSTETGRQRLAQLLQLSGAAGGVFDYLTETGLSLSAAAAQAPSTGSLAPLIAASSQAASQQAAQHSAEQVAATVSVREAVDELRGTIEDWLTSGRRWYGNGGSEVVLDQP